MAISSESCIDEACGIFGEFQNRLAAADEQAIEEKLTLAKRHEYRRHDTLYRVQKPWASK